MNSELIYLLLFGLMMAVCCYHMMRMMMKGSEPANHTIQPLAPFAIDRKGIVRNMWPGAEDFEYFQRAVWPHL